jgi:hypothetical protein
MRDKGNRHGRAGTGSVCAEMFQDSPDRASRITNSLPLKGSREDIAAVMLPPARSAPRKWAERPRWAAGEADVKQVAGIVAGTTTNDRRLS